MTTFERAFSDTEEAAVSTLRAVKDVGKLAKALQKAAREGNIGAIKRECSRLDPTLDSLKEEVSNAVAIWPFKDEEEEAYLRDHYADELRKIAAEKGLDLRERDGMLISHPSIVRVLPGDRAVRIDKSKKATLRPSRLTEILVEQQKKPPRFRSDAFLKSLYEMYVLLAKVKQGTVIPLAMIYEAFTSCPGSKRDYSKIDFARDIYFLEQSGTLFTRSGYRVSFPSSTGLKKAKDTFSFVGPDKQVVTYYGIQFSGGG